MLAIGGGLGRDSFRGLRNLSDTSKLRKVLKETDSVLFVLEGVRAVLQVLACGPQLVVMRASCASHTANNP